MLPKSNWAREPAWCWESWELASSFLSVVGEGYVKKAFSWKEEFSKYVVVDEIKRQFKEYQKEKIPEEFCKICKADNVEKKPRQSYWNQAYLQLQMPTESAEEEEYLCLNDYWVKVFEIKSSPSFSLQLITISGITFN